MPHIHCAVTSCLFAGRHNTQTISVRVKIEYSKWFEPPIAWKFRALYSTLMTGLACAIFINHIIYFGSNGSHENLSLLCLEISSIKSGSITHSKLDTNKSIRAYTKITKYHIYIGQNEGKTVAVMAVKKSLFHSLKTKCRASLSPPPSSLYNKWWIQCLSKLKREKNEKKIQDVCVSVRVEQKPSKNRTHHRYWRMMNEMKKCAS